MGVQGLNDSTTTAFLGRTTNPLTPRRNTYGPIRFAGRRYDRGHQEVDGPGRQEGGFGASPTPFRLCCVDSACAHAPPSVFAPHGGGNWQCTLRPHDPALSYGPRAFGPRSALRPPVGVSHPPISVVLLSLVWALRVFLPSLSRRYDGATRGRPRAIRFAPPLARP